MKLHLSLLAAATVLTATASAQMSGQQSGYGNGGMNQPQSSYGQQGYGQAGYGTAGNGNFQSLSGQWYLSTQQYGTDSMPWQVQVSANGQFQGTQQTAQGPSYIQGQFNGMMANGVLVAPDIRVRGKTNRSNIRIQFDGQCHAQMTMMDARGKPAAQGTMHINHKTGPCPQ